MNYILCSQYHLREGRWGQYLEHNNSLSQSFSNCSSYQNYLKGFLKHRMLGPSPRVLVLTILVGAWEFSFGTSSQAMLILLVHRMCFENPLNNSILGGGGGSEALDYSRAFLLPQPAGASPPTPLSAWPLASRLKSLLCLLDYFTSSVLLPSLC